MKKTTLFGTLFCVSMSGAIYAQTNQTTQSDLDALTQPQHTGHPHAQTNVTPKSGSANLVVSGNSISSCDSGSVTLSATGVCDYSWYADSLGQNLLVDNNDLTTGMIYNDTAFYVGVTEYINESLVAMPAMTGTFSSNVRGYWFQSPINMIITGVTIPTSASTGLISAAIVKFNAGEPPLYSSTTNDFELLGYWPGYSQDTIYTCLAVSAGDYIGVLGYRGTTNAYAAPTTISIGGNSVAISRVGMQYDLTTTSPQDLWQETGGNISIVELVISTDLDTVYNEVSVHVPKSSFSSDSIAICAGDSVFAAGSYQYTTGIYTDSLFTVSGCDSVIVTNLYVKSQLANTISLSGIDLIADQDSAVYQWYTCQDSLMMAGETNQVFTPTVDGLYYVTVADSGCTVTSACFNVNYMGITENSFATSVNIYPNPASSDAVTIKLGDIQAEMTIHVVDINGKIILSQQAQNTDTMTLFLNVEKGIYFIEIAGAMNEKAIVRVEKM